MKPTVYIETTIVSYLTCRPSKQLQRRANEQITREWWKTRREEFELFTSQFTIDEAGAGDASAAAKRVDALTGIPLLQSEPSVFDLAEALMKAIRLPPKARVDAAHVAIAAFHQVDFVLTWNCRHLANGQLLPRIHRVCASHGYVAPVILTPNMLMGRP